MTDDKGNSPDWTDPKSIRRAREDAVEEWLLNQPFRFWACPVHPEGAVSWAGDRATCDVCGQTNHPLDVPGVTTVLVICDRWRKADAWAQEQKPDAISFNQARYMFGKTHYWFLHNHYQAEGLDRKITRYLLLDYDIPQVKLRRFFQQSGIQALAIPRQWRAYRFHAGGQVKVAHSGDIVTFSASGVDHQPGSWLPHSGLFGLTPEAGNSPVDWEKQEELGWFRQVPGHGTMISVFTPFGLM